MRWSVFAAFLYQLISPVHIVVAAADGERQDGVVILPKRCICARSQWSVERDVSQNLLSADPTTTRQRCMNCQRPAMSQSKIEARESMARGSDLGPDGVGNRLIECRAIRRCRAIGRNGRSAERMHPLLHRSDRNGSCGKLGTESGHIMRAALGSLEVRAP